MSRYLNGSTDRLRQPDMPVSATMSFSLWVKINALPPSGTHDCLSVVHEHGAAEPYTSYGDVLYISSTGQIKAAYYDPGSSVGRLVSSTTLLPTGQWHHIGVEFISTGVWIIINGLREAATSGGAHYTAYTDPSFAIGATTSNFYVGGTIASFDGDVADVGVWSRALTNAEWNELSTAVRPDALADTSGLVSTAYFDGDLDDEYLTADYVATGTTEDTGDDPAPTQGGLRESQAVVEALADDTPSLRVSQTVVEALANDTPSLRVSQTVVEVLWALEALPPEGGGEVPPGTNPPSDPVPVGVVRLFGLLTYGGSPQTELKVSETALSDPASWYGGFGHPILLSLSSYTRELTDGVRAVEVRVELADTDRRFRTLAATDTLGGATWEHFLVSDTVRYALGVPHRRFCGRVHEHRALPGFRYELLVRDVLSEEMASLADAPRIPQKLSLLDLPGMSAEYEGLALQIAIGQLNDEDELGGSPTSLPQGVVPPLVVAPLINFQTAFGGIDQDVIATVVTHGALAPTGVWRVYYNTPTDPYTRIEVPPSVWGTLLWAPGQAGWSDTGLPNDYADYPADPTYTNRLTPFYIAADHANSAPFLDGRILVGINLYGVTENADGTGLYLSDAPRVYQWLLSNFLYSNWKTGAYNDPPTFANGATIINTDSVETTTERLRGFLGSAGTDAYPVGFLIGRGGQQQTLRHILGELCHGVAMEQGTDRHGRIMLDVEDVDAVATVTLSDLLDIENGEFEVWVDRSAYRNCLEYVHGYRYVPAVAPLPTPPEGETLPVKNLGPHADWTSGLVKIAHADAIAANGGRRTPPMQLENYVVRAPMVAADWAGRLLARAVGPSPSFDGPRMFRLTTSWQALDVELGTVIAIDHIEGLGATGYEGQRARVLKITDDLQRARIVLEGRVLFS